MVVNGYSGFMLIYNSNKGAEQDCRGNTQEKILACMQATTALASHNIALTTESAEFSYVIMHAIIMRSPTSIIYCHKSVKVVQSYIMKLTKIVSNCNMRCNTFCFFNQKRKTLQCKYENLNAVLELKRNILVKDASLSSYETYKFYIDMLIAQH